MQKTATPNNSNRNMFNNITVNTDTLTELLDCAKIKIGKRVLWNTEKIKDYLNNQMSN